MECSVNYNSEKRREHIDIISNYIIKPHTGKGRYSPICVIVTVTGETRKAKLRSVTSLSEIICFLPRRLPLTQEI